eukprot:TRINITY_DN3191_c0_g1_i1.p2 TRINITY_DN3191_c0_g1~~TRINITY_DN3191_c0_g1_i1.p2  ORF type:complete len:242 (+),score=88.45 TRINITY_DN3191_c0_g1_i1:94-819(+)
MSNPAEMADPESRKKFFDKMAREYRQRSLAVPGVNSLHAMVRAWFETKLKDEANVLVCACGGGAEVDALAPSERRFRILGFDNSEPMLEVAKEAAEKQGASDRSTFILGTLDAVPAHSLFDAATSILVMHFFPDDGTKLEFLRGIRSRLRDGAPIALVDMSCSDEELIRLGPVWVQHARVVDPELGTFIEKMLPASMTAWKNRISPQRTEQLLLEAGFTNVTPFFRGLWIVGWFAEAAGSV